MTSKIKKQLIAELSLILKKKIDVLATTIKEAHEAQANDTKSSAGDKFETGREMIQIELNKNQIQLSKTKELLNEVSKIESLPTQKKATFGSLILSENEGYFLSIAHGKIQIDNNIYYAISLASPIGKALVGKQKGDSCIFQGRNIVIQDIL